MKKLKIFFILIASMSLCLAATMAPKPPVTQKKPVTDEYYGIKVIDNYRWLENFQDPAVQQWIKRENEYSRSILDKVPKRPEIEKRLKELLEAPMVSYSGMEYRGGYIFAIKTEPPAEQPYLITLKTPFDKKSEHVVIDLNKLDPSGATAMDWYVPSLDGRMVAVSLSKSGSLEGVVHIFDVATGKRLPDVIQRVQFATAGGSAAWNSDNTGLYVTRYPAPGERPEADIHFYQQIYFHRLGTPADQDKYSVGKEFPRIAEIEMQNSEDGKYILASVKNGDGGEAAQWLLGPSGKWKQVSRFADKAVKGFFGPDDSLFLLSRNEAPRGQVLKLAAGQTDLSKATTLIPASDAVIEDVVPTPGHIYVIDMVGGPSQVRVFNALGKDEKKIPLQPISAVGGALHTFGDSLLYNERTYLTPPAWFEYDPKTGNSIKTALFSTSPADFSDSEVRRELATSKDGTKVPLNIILKKGTKLGGQNPTLLYGYGGYGSSMEPRFSAVNRMWLDHGGIYVDTNIRGGGEYGEEWHMAGNLTRKQNVFDDFIACAEYLIKNKYTSPAKLGILGGSNGGLLMGAVLTQRPDLFRAVVSTVGIYDSLRVELSPNGAFNVTEFGTVKNPEQFKALYAYSPYHHVKEGTAYPAVLMMTGDHDFLVDPMNSRKMIAALQAANKSDHPILLCTTSKAGHGIGSALSVRVAQAVDLYSFLFDQLGMK
jgi:prolyl oligopeptidase